MNLLPFEENVLENSLTAYPQEYELSSTYFVRVKGKFLSWGAVFAPTRWLSRVLLHNRLQGQHLLWKSALVCAERTLPKPGVFGKQNEIEKAKQSSAILFLY